MANGGTLVQFPTARRTAGPARAPRRDRAEAPTVLAVDDLPVVLELVDAFLQDSGYRVYLAEGGRRALEICHRLEGRVDLLLTDVRMPGMNGPELHQVIVDSFPGVKALYMSAFSAAEAARFGVPEGAPLVVKPFRPEELLERVQQAIADSEPAATRHPRPRGLPAASPAD
jgi:CheY-like chemotaxis protein